MLLVSLSLHLPQGMVPQCKSWAKSRVLAAQLHWFKVWHWGKEPASDEEHGHNLLEKPQQCKPNVLPKTWRVLLTARSTRCSLPMRTCMFPSTPFSLHSMVIVKMACERELCSFMFVAPTEPFNRGKKAVMSSELITSSSNSSCSQGRLIPTS